MKNTNAIAMLVLTAWCSTATAAETKPITVAATGGDFATLQAAIDALPKNDKSPKLIVIQPGTYKQVVKIDKSVSNLVIRGAGKTPADTVLTFDNYAQKKDEKGNNIGTRGSASVVIEGSDITCENLTFENSAGDIGQAVALRTAGDRLVFRKCRLTGWQDTLYDNDGRHYYEDCYIEGRVDFIFGRGVTVFNRCELKSKNGGYVTAASTNEKEPYGYVFLDCKLTHDPKPFTGSGGDAPVPTYLGRPWRPMASTIFIRCDMGPHIRAEGWSEWKDDKGQPKPARYAEFASTGPGANAEKRVAWSKQLTKAEAEAITIESVLSGKDGWNPMLNIENDH
ncbi:MAG: pectinesterase family protein [Tepidisphaeraceae bacterium]